MVVKVPACVNPGSTALLLPPRSEDTFDEACIRLLAGDEPRRRNVVTLTIDRSAEAFIDAWSRYVGVRPADLHIVDVGTDVRSVTAESADPSACQNVIRSVGDFQDIAAIRNQLDDLLTVPITSDETRIFYFDSLSAMLQDVGSQIACGFLDHVVDLIQRTKSVGFVRVDRTAHSDQTINVVTSLVDATLSLDTTEEECLWALLSGRPAMAEIDDGDMMLSIDDQFALLSDRHRRLALHCLYEADEQLATFDLATRLADVETPEDNVPRSEALRRIYTGLIHIHLPKLEAHGVVSVDTDEEAIRLREPAKYLEPLLALAINDDLHG